MNEKGKDHRDKKSFRGHDNCGDRKGEPRVRGGVRGAILCAEALYIFMLGLTQRRRRAFIDAETGCVGGVNLKKLFGRMQNGQWRRFHYNPNMDEGSGSGCERGTRDRRLGCTSFETALTVQ